MVTVCLLCGTNQSQDASTTARAASIHLMKCEDAVPASESKRIISLGNGRKCVPGCETM